MGIKERKARQRGDVRHGILAAARAIAARDGWQAVTIRKIAERIEYSPPVIYEHFTAKEEILAELMRQGYAEQRAAMEAARDAADGPVDALIAMARAYIAFAFRSPDLYQVMYGLGGVPFSAAETGREGAPIAATMGNVVEEILRVAGRPASGIDNKVTLLWSTGHGLVSLAMIERLAGGESRIEDLAEHAVRDAVAAWITG